MKIILCMMCFLLCACAADRPNSRHEAKILQNADFTEQYLPTQTFILYSLLRKARGDSKTLHVYIEGDGRAWITRSKASNDPTPEQPTVLALAQNDKSSAAVLYLARPCQYVQGANARMCQQKYWTTHRLAPEVITSLNEAINIVKNNVGAKDVVLVGYSGGGAAAALLAAQRNDVRFLGTLAANLDHEAWTKFHKVSPMIGSQNPIHFADKIQNIPQRHMSSYADEIVPPAISLQFCKKIHDLDSCVTVQGMKHTGRWEKVWDYRYK